MRLALVGTGVYSSVPEVCRQAVREVESHSPNAESVRGYQAAHDVYQALYPALKPVYSMITSLRPG